MRNSLRQFSLFGSALFCLSTVFCAPLWAQEAEGENVFNNGGTPTITEESRINTPQEQDADSEGVEAPYPTSSESVAPAQDDDETPVPMRGDDGVLLDFRPSGLVFLAPNRVLVCDSASQQLHIFDTEGRRFRRLPIARYLPEPSYSGVARLGEESFLVVGDHYHVNNDVRYVGAHSALHRYSLRGEVFTDDSAEVDFDPNIALRCTKLLGEKLERRMEISGVAVDQPHDRIFFSLAKPLNDSDSVIVYSTSLQQTLNRDKKCRVVDIELDLVPHTDPLTNQYYQLSDICHVEGRGLLLLLSSKSGNTFGSNQIWYKPDNASSPRLVLEDFAPGSFGTGIAAIENEDGLYDLGLTFDNNPGETSNPSSFLMLRDVEL